MNDLLDLRRQLQETGRYLLVNYCQKHMPCRWKGRRIAYLLSYSQCWTFR